jgi:hypothetical protein
MVRAGRLDGLHAVVAVRRGETVLEYYGHGLDQAWATPLGMVQFKPDTLHEWREDLPYDSPANAEIAMERAPDRYRYVLERLVVVAGLDLVVAIAAGNYDRPEQWRTPAAVLEQVVAAAGG